MAVIETVGLTKFYGKHRGVEGVDLVVERGEVFGFLGPNGAGKSTTIRMLVDLLRPTSGLARVLGLDPRADSVALRAKVGYLPGDLSLYPRMTGRQVCGYFAALRGHTLTSSIDALAERLDLDLDRVIDDYSTGNRQKVGLVQAFMHDPELLILDEPTAGLDPLMQQEFYRLVNEVIAEGRSVFLSSHVLPEVEHVAHRVGIIREGRLAVVEEITTLKERAARRLELHFADAVRADEFIALDSVRSAHEADDGHTIMMVVEGSVDQVIKKAANHEVLNVITHDGDLEDVFLDYYSGGGS